MTDGEYWHTISNVSPGVWYDYQNYFGEQQTGLQVQYTCTTGSVMKCSTELTQSLSVSIASGT